jgi:hypothetical protein
MPAFPRAYCLSGDNKTNAPETISSRPSGRFSRGLLELGIVEIAAQDSARPELEA